LFDANSELFDEILELSDKNSQLFDENL